MDISEIIQDFKENPGKETRRIIRIPLVVMAGIIFLNWVNTSSFTGWSSAILNNVTEAFIGFGLIWLGDRLFAHERAHKLKQKAMAEDASEHDKIMYAQRMNARLIMVGLMLLGVFASAA